MPENPLQNMINTLSPHLGFTPERLERFFAWAQYLHWADLHRRRFLAWEKADDMEANWQLFALMSAWYASLWVVVEGWREIPLSDPSVDELLASNPRYLDLLKRYRNGVFHYQPRIGDRRVKDLLVEGETSAHWIVLFHQEFCRFYWELVNRPPLPLELASEIRDCVLDIVGWIPSDIVLARAEALREKADQAVSLLRENGDFESDGALKLLDAARGAADGAAEAEHDYQRLKSEAIRRIKRRSGPS